MSLSGVKRELEITKRFTMLTRKQQILSLSCFGSKSFSVSNVRDKSSKTSVRKESGIGDQALQGSQFIGTTKLTKTDMQNFLAE